MLNILNNRQFEYISLNLWFLWYKKSMQLSQETLQKNSYPNDLIMFLKLSAQTLQFAFCHDSLGVFCLKLVFFSGHLMYQIYYENCNQFALVYKAIA